MDTSKRTGRWYGPAMAALFVVGACSGSDGKDGAQGPAAAMVTVAPSTASVAVGGKVTLMAASTKTGDMFTWASSDAAVATVSATGEVTGVAEGIALVSATGSESGTAGFAAISVKAGTAGAVSFAKDLLPLFTKPNMWQAGTASCAAKGCHTGVGGAHDLDMSSYAGIMAGTDAGTEAIVFTGTDPKGPEYYEESMLRTRLRDNRMPFGISPLIPRDGPMVKDVAPIVGWMDASSTTDTNRLMKVVDAWLGSGAPNGPFPYTPAGSSEEMRNFDNDILPLFTTPGVWAPATPACNSAGCHNGVGGAHDLDMSTYASILAGTDGGTEAIVLTGTDPEKEDYWQESMLRQRLRNNRMPWGISTAVPRNGANNEIAKLDQWLMGGAKDN